MRAVVTGGNRGIGLAIARKLADKGIDLILVGKNRKTLESVKKELSEKVDVSVFACDVGNDKEIKRLFKNKKIKGFDILVNNAGVAYYEPLSEMDERKIDEIIDVNLRGLIKFTKAAIPKMKKGIIINISSGAGKTGYSNFAVYCATKFGVIGFTESLAGELDNIKVFAVCPGGTQTDMWESLFPGEHASYRPEDVADTVMHVIENSKRIRPGAAIDVR